jgi:methylglyoxal synthase
MRQLPSLREVSDDSAPAGRHHLGLRRYSINAAGTTATYLQTYFDARWGRLRASVMGPNQRLFLTTSNDSADMVIRITPS